MLGLTEIVRRISGAGPMKVRKDLLRGPSGDMMRRRSIVGTSLLGIASMAAVSLLQTGIVRHLPDPPIKGFNSDKVNLGRTAYQFGAPDGTFAVASLSLNLPLAALGGAVRPPWIPLVAAGKAAVDAAAAAWYFYQMPTKEKAWCAYCITGAAANAVIFALALPEAKKAARRG